MCALTFCAAMTRQNEKASIIRSSICTEQVDRYNVRVVVGSAYGVVRCVFVMAQRAVDMGRRLDL